MRKKAIGNLCFFKKRDRLTSQTKSIDYLLNIL